MEKNLKKPLISVIMPVYNAEKYLSQAIESILQQTYKNFEFIIIDDHSTDGSLVIIEKYQLMDRRIVLIRNKKNLDVAASLNRGLEIAKGGYIVRMDADDISLPNRFITQLHFMQSHPDVGILGSWVLAIGEGRNGVWRYPLSFKSIQAEMIFNTPMAHPSIMISRKLMDKYHVKYRPKHYAQDFYLFLESSRYFKLVNIPKVLVYRRVVPGSSSSYASREIRSMRVIFPTIFKKLGIKWTAQQLQIHIALAFQKYRFNKNFLVEVDSWLMKLKDANDSSEIFDKLSFDRVLGSRWLRVCNALNPLGMFTWRNFWGSELSGYTDINWRQKLGLFINCLTKKRIL
jgi:glycosyltransferase involved in cell wall biosynthesis